MLEIFVDADACPVKQEVLKVAKRLQLHVTFVANSRMNIPDSEGSDFILIESKQLDAADDWIADHVSKDDLVITADIPLADRCVKKGAKVLNATGQVLSENNIGQILATRDLMASLRDSGMITGGPAPSSKQDRSHFLHSLDQVIQQIKRANTPYK